MTVDELLARESIRAILAKYNVSGDRLKADDLAACFTDDGVLESEFVPESDAFRFVGRNNIKGWLQRWTQGNAAQEQTHAASFVRHHLSTCHIELLDDHSAHTRTYWTAYTDIGPDHCGYYLDTFEKIGEQWLIAHRRVRLDWRSPDSLFVKAVLNSR